MKKRSLKEKLIDVSRRLKNASNQDLFLERHGTDVFLVFNMINSSVKTLIQSIENNIDIINEVNIDGIYFIYLLYDENTSLKELRTKFKFAEKLYISRLTLKNQNDLSKFVNDLKSVKEYKFFASKTLTLENCNLDNLEQISEVMTEIFTLRLDNTKMKSLKPYKELAVIS